MNSTATMFIPELGMIEPRPCHEHFPVKPRSWQLTDVTAWGADSRSISSALIDVVARPHRPMGAGAADIIVIVLPEIGYGSKRDRGSPAATWAPAALHPN